MLQITTSVTRNFTSCDHAPMRWPRRLPTTLRWWTLAVRKYPGSMSPPVYWHRHCAGCKCNHNNDCLSRSLDKAALLLDALEVQAKNVTYYALDLDHAELQKTLCRLPLGKYKHVQCVGLQGTFEDGLEWIKNDPEQSRRPHCLLFLGSTIGNFSRENAARFIRSMASSAFLSESAKSSIILSIDSCKLPTKVLRAYNSEGVVPFAMAGLKHASAILCEAACRQEDAVTETFLPDDWYYLSHYNHVLGRHEASFTPRNRDIQLGSPLEDVVIRLGETIRFGYSHKYDFAEIEQLFREAGVAAVNSWGAVGCDLSRLLQAATAPSRSFLLVLWLTGIQVSTNLARRNDGAVSETSN